MTKGNDGWLRCEIDGRLLQSLRQRSDTKGLVNLGFFLGPLIVVGYLSYAASDTAWAPLLFWVYGSIYGFSISLLHETHHGTAFLSRRINQIAHTVAGLMTLRNPLYDRFLHAQHHANTSVSGFDPELAHPKPIVVWKLLLDLFWLRAAVNLPILLVKQALGRYSAEERAILPERLHGRIRWMAVFILAVYGVLIALCVVNRTWSPLLFTYLAHIYGGFLPRLFALTQHLGLAQDENDFRLTTRTCVYNPVAATWYWNMNYHIEHHMFPLVPFHALPELHAALKKQMPAATQGVIAAWREILACIGIQRKTPGHTISKAVPENA